MKKNARFNLIDVCIILVIVCVIFGGIYVIKNLKGDTSSGKVEDTVTIRYTVELKEEDEEILNAFLEAKDSDGFVYVGEKERAKAYIKEISYEEAKKQSTNLKTGEVKWTNIPNKYMLNVVLESEATETETDLKADGGAAIKVGDETSVKGKGFAGYGYIISLEKVEGEAE